MPVSIASLPLVHLVDVLRAPVVGLESREAKAGLRGDVPGQRDRRLAGRDAAAEVADVDLDQDGQAHAGGARRCVEVVDVPRVIDAHGDLGLPGERDEPLDLAPVHDLVRDEDVPHAPATMASASLTFWQQDPTAPRAIWWSATTGHLWVFAWPRRRTGVPASEAAIRSRLCS